jgi:hypothetical protein
MNSKNKVLKTTMSRNTACVKSSDTSIMSFIQPAYVSHKGGESMLIMKQTLWEKNLNFVKKNIPMTYINFTIIVTIVAEKK